MKVKVKTEFTDKYTHLRHKAGAVIEVSEARAKELSAKGIVEMPDDEPKPKGKKK